MSKKPTYHELQAENEQLKAALVHTTIQQSKLLIPSRAVAPDAIKRSYMAQGARQAIEDMEPVRRAARNVFQIFSNIQAVAFCDNGPRTRRVMDELLSDMLANMERFDNEYQRSEGAFVRLGPEISQLIADFAKQVRPYVKRYLIAGTDASLKELRGIITANRRELESINNEIDDLPKRGRERDAVIDLGARMAKAIKADNHTERGLELYQQLITIPESARDWRHNGLIADIEQYLTDDCRRVNYDKSRAFQQFISKLYRRSSKSMSQK